MQHGLQAHAGAGGESGRVAYRDRRAGAQVAARTACPRRAVVGPGTGAKASATARAVAKRTRRIHVMVLQRQLLKWLSGATLHFAAAARRALLPRPVDAVSRCNAYAPVLARFRRSSPQNAHTHTGLPTAQHPSPTRCVRTAGSGSRSGGCLADEVKSLLFRDSTDPCFSANKGRCLENTFNLLCGERIAAARLGAYR